MRGFSLVLSARVASALITAVATLYLARLLSPLGFGEFAVWLAIISTVMALSCGGLQTLSMRMHGKVSRRSVSLMVMRLQRRQTAVVAMFTLAVGVVGILLWELPLWVTSVILWQWAEKEVTGWIGIATAEDRHDLQFPALLITRVAGIVGLTISERSDIGPVVGYASASTMACITVIIWLSRRIGQANRPMVGSPRLGNAARRHAISLWVASASGQVRALDVALVSASATTYQAGLYALPARVAAPVRLAATTMAYVALPLASRGDTAQIKRLTRGVWFITVVALVAAVPILFNAGDILAVLVGEKYRAASGALVFIGVASLIGMPGSYMSGVLQGTGMHAYVARLGVILMVITTVMVPVGAYFGGAVGAAAAMLLVSIIQVWTVSWKTLQGVRK